MQQAKRILVALPVELVLKLDEAAEVLMMTRTDIIRRSLLRDMDFITENELQRARRHQQETRDIYEEWQSTRQHGWPKLVEV